MTTISLKLPMRLLRMVEKEVRARGSTRSEVVRDALEQMLSKQTKKKPLSCYDLTRDLVGSLKGSPDLSTNPKYMEGYGE